MAGEVGLKIRVQDCLQPFETKLRRCSILEMWKTRIVDTDIRSEQLYSNDTWKLPEKHQVHIFSTFIVDPGRRHFPRISKWADDLIHAYGLYLPITKLKFRVHTLCGHQQFHFVHLLLLTCMRYLRYEYRVISVLPLSRVQNSRRSPGDVEGKELLKWTSRLSESNFGRRPYRQEKFSCFSVLFASVQSSSSLWEKAVGFLSV